MVPRKEIFFSRNFDVTQLLWLPSYVAMSEIQDCNVTFCESFVKVPGELSSLNYLTFILTLSLSLSLLLSLSQSCNSLSHSLSVSLFLTPFLSGSLYVYKHSYVYVYIYIYMCGYTCIHIYIYKIMHDLPATVWRHCSAQVCGQGEDLGRVQPLRCHGRLLASNR